MVVSASLMLNAWTILQRDSFFTRAVNYGKVSTGTESCRTSPPCKRDDRLLPRLAHRGGFASRTSSSPANPQVPSVYFQLSTKTSARLRVLSRCGARVGSSAPRDVTSTSHATTSPCSSAARLLQQSVGPPHRSPAMFQRCLDGERSPAKSAASCTGCSAASASVRSSTLVATVSRGVLSHT